VVRPAELLAAAVVEEKGFDEVVVVTALGM
jgi:hypothetical protein